MGSAGGRGGVESEGGGVRPGGRGGGPSVGGALSISEPVESEESSSRGVGGGRGEIGRGGGPEKGGDDGVRGGRGGAAGGAEEGTGGITKRGGGGIRSGVLVEAAEDEELSLSYPSSLQSSSPPPILPLELERLRLWECCLVSTIVPSLLFRTTYVCLTGQILAFPYLSLDTLSQALSDYHHERRKLLRDCGV